MIARSLTLVLLLAAAPVVAHQSKSAKSAKAFQLDGVAPTPDATPTPEPRATPDTAPSPAATPDASPALATPAVSDGAAATAPDAATPADGALRATFTLDTPIAALIADPAAKAVLDKDLPGLSDDENLAKFDKIGLRQFQPMTGGQLTDAMLVKVARDLSKLSGPVLAPIAPTRTGNSKRNRDTSR